ncbi:MAG: hypothetical protein HEEMFOPI_00278 [Holosporales bacterium]
MKVLFSKLFMGVFAFLNICFSTANGMSRSQLGENKIPDQEMVSLYDSPKSRTSDEKSFMTFSYSGGGIRGYMEALITAKIEEVTGKYISDIGDLFVGTSAGSFNVAFLTQNPPKPASELVKIYEGSFQKLFNRSIFYRIKTLNGLIDNMYPQQNLYDLTALFPDVKLSQTRKPVGIVAWNLTKTAIETFSSKNNPTMPLRTAVAASTAYPAAFSPIYYGANTYIDGGMGAKNPALEGLKLAREYNKFGKKNVIVSIDSGTVKLKNTVNPDHDGKIQELSSVFSFLSVGQDSAIETALGLLNDGRETEIIKLFPSITEDSYSADDITPENIERLKGFANKLMETDTFKSFLEMVNKH